MRKSISALLIGSVLTLGAVAAYAAVNAQGPTTEELEADLATLDEALAGARAELSSFNEGSLLHTNALLHIQMLENTRAMIDQKRLSWLRGISLSYVVQGQEIAPADPAVIDALNQEIEDLTQQTIDAEIRSNQYGGLVGTMALVEVQTSRVTMAMARQKLFAARYGISWPLLDVDLGNGAPKVPETPLSRSVDDKGAL